MSHLKNKTFRAALLVLCWVITMPALADVLLIEGVDAAATRQLPQTGQSKTQVRDLWGPPAEEFAAVGQPPITRWVYADFSVFFEYDHVITSVLHEGAVVGYNQN
ncbi:MAG: hypothetical protein Tsb002_00130 [Wenzhouxiangellaceae bacterium]